MDLSELNSKIFSFEKDSNSLDKSKKDLISNE
jgi:hypothetical protein